MKRITIYIDNRQYAKLKGLKQSGINLSEHIRKAIDKYLEKFTPEISPVISPSDNKPAK